MIRLETLKAQGIKNLEIPAPENDFDKLEFPDRGKVFIHGLNEAGKSTLFEAIYFAMFGTALVPDRSRASMSELLAYDREKGLVELEFTVENTLYRLRRTIKETGSGINYSHRLVIEYPDRDQDAVTGARSVNSRIEQELGLDGDALLNSCFVEQKNLGRLEDSSRRKREESIATLLNLERFTAMENSYSSEQNTAEERQERAEQKLELAQLAQKQIPSKEAELDTVDTKIKIVEQKQEIQELCNDIEEEKERIRELTSELESLQEELEEIKQLEKELPQKRSRKEDLDSLYTDFERFEKLSSKQAELEELRQLDERIEQLEASIEQEKAQKAEVVDLYEDFERLEKLDAARGDLQQVEELEAEIVSIKETLNTKQKRLNKLNDLQSDFKLLRQVQDAHDDLKQLENLENEIETLNTDLSKKETRLERLEALYDDVKRLEELQESDAELSQLAELNSQIAELEEELDELVDRRDTTKIELESVESELEKIEYRDLLIEWERLTKAANREERIERKEQELEQQKDEKENNLAQVEEKQSAVSTKRTATVGSAGIIVVASAVAGVAVSPLSFAGVFFGIVIAAVGYVVFDTSEYNDTIESLDTTISDIENELIKLEGQRDDLTETGAEAPAGELKRTEEQIQSLGQPIPETLDECDQLREQLSTGSDDRTKTELEARRDEVSDKLSRVKQTIETKQSDLETARTKYDEFDKEKIQQRRQSLKKTILQSDIFDGRQGDVSEDTTIDDVEDVVKKRADTLSVNLGAEAVSSARSSLETELDTLQSELESKREAVTEYDREGLEAQIQTCKQELGDQNLSRSELQKNLTARAEELGVEASSKSLTSAITSLETEIESLDQKLEEVTSERDNFDRDTITQRIHDLKEKIAGEIKPREQIYNDLASRASDLELEPEKQAINSAISSLETELKNDRTKLHNAEETRSEYDKESIEERINSLKDSIAGVGYSREEILSILKDRASDCDVEADKERINSVRSSLQTEIQNIQSQIEEKSQVKENIEEKKSQINTRQTSVEAAETSIAELEAEIEAEPYDPKINDETALEKERDEVVGELGDLRGRRDKLQEELGLPSIPKLDEVEKELADARHAVKRYGYAEEIVNEAKDQVMRNILPNTEANMARFLPILTNGRYKDVKIDPKTYTIEAYDARAQTYKSKGIFSGGTRDQFSLALRLSFAMATLPQERGTAPDFLYLDEPVGSFDQQRRAALTELLTRGEIAENFGQIFVVSHVEDLREEFDYRIKMEDGRIVEKELEP